MSLTVYVIYHDVLLWENYRRLDPEELDLITFVCVNKSIPKREDFTPKRLICEWDLPEYDENLQRLHVCDETMVPKSHFNETGVHWHLALNKVCTTDFIYVCHNDMLFTQGSLKHIQSLLKPGRGITIARANFDTLVNTSTYGQYELSMYTYTCKELGVDTQKMFPMFTNCAMETKVFEEQMHKLIHINKKLFLSTLPGPSYRPAITFERTWALAMGTALNEVLVVNGILHGHPPTDQILIDTEGGTKTQYPQFS